MVLVDQARYRMQVRVGGRVTREVEIGLGQASGQKRREGDLRTPKGIYFVVDKQKGQLRRRTGGEYFGGYWIKVNYPGPADAAWGRERRGRRRGRGGDRRRLERAEADAAEHAARQRHRVSRLGVRVERGRGAHLSFGCVVMHNRDIATWFDEVAPERWS